MRPTKINWDYKISRARMYKLLGFESDTIPADYDLVQFHILTSDNGSLIGDYFVKVDKSQANGKRKIAKHRIFIVCDCGRNIPFGRFHQHKPYCK